MMMMGNEFLDLIFLLRITVLAQTTISIPVAAAPPCVSLHDDPSSDRGELWTLWTSWSDPGFLPWLFLRVDVRDFRASRRSDRESLCLAWIGAMVCRESAKLGLFQVTSS